MPLGLHLYNCVLANPCRGGPSLSQQQQMGLTMRSNTSFFAYLLTAMALVMMTLFFVYPADAKDYSCGNNTTDIWGFGSSRCNEDQSRPERSPASHSSQSPSPAPTTTPTEPVDTDPADPVDPVDPTDPGCKGKCDHDDNGHGNDDDHDDDSNPGQGGGNHGTKGNGGERGSRSY